MIFILRGIDIECHFVAHTHSCLSVFFAYPTPIDIQTHTRTHTHTLQISIYQCNWACAWERSHNLHNEKSQGHRTFKFRCGTPTTRAKTTRTQIYANNENFSTKQPLRRLRLLLLLRCWCVFLNMAPSGIYAPSSLIDSLCIVYIYECTLPINYK